MPEKIQNKKTNKSLKTNLSDSFKGFDMKKAVVSFLIVLVLGLACVLIAVGVSKDKVECDFPCSKENKSIGEVMSLTVSKSRYAYCIYYPKLPFECLNEYISKQNEEIQDAFLKYLKSPNVSEIADGSVMKSDYSASEFGKFIQIERSSVYKIPGEKNFNNVNIILFDTQKKKILSADDVFDRTFYDFIKPRMINRFCNRDNISEEDAREKFNNFKLENFSFQDNALNIYFKDMKGSYDCVQFDVDSMVKSHLKFDYDVEIVNNGKKAGNDPGSLNKISE